VYFDTNKVIREAFGEAGYPVPQQHLSIAQIHRLSYLFDKADNSPNYIPELLIEA